jgi:hypothetical protein
MWTFDKNIVVYLTFETALLLLLLLCNCLETQCPVYVPTHVSRKANSRLKRPEVAKAAFF